MRFAPLAIVLLYWIAGCSAPSSPSYNYTFINNSSYALHISPNAQSWAAFDLPAAQRHTLSTQYSLIYFSFDQTTLVLCDTSHAATVIFTNAIVSKLEVIGTPGNPAASAYITYTVGLDTVQVNNGNLVSLPWSYSFAGYSGEGVYLIAIQNPANGYVTATIYTNASVFQTASSSASSDSAELNGVLP